MSARGDDRRRLERIYWFTVEFGLINTPDGIRIYGKRHFVLFFRNETLSHA